MGTGGLQTKPLFLETVLYWTGLYHLQGLHISSSSALWLLVLITHPEKKTNHTQGWYCTLWDSLAPGPATRSGGYGRGSSFSTATSSLLRDLSPNGSLCVWSLSNQGCKYQFRVPPLRGREVQGRLLDHQPKIKHQNLPRNHDEKVPSSPTSEHAWVSSPPQPRERKWLTSEWEDPFQNQKERERDLRVRHRVVGSGWPPGWVHYLFLETGLELNKQCL